MAGDSVNSANDGGMVGPIIFVDPAARAQLETEGSVITFRPDARTTGETWWRSERTGSKQGECHVRLVQSGLTAPATMNRHVELSGFEDVPAWREAIRELHGDVPTWGYYYQVRSRSQARSRSRSQDTPAGAQDGARGR